MTDLTAAAAQAQRRAAQPALSAWVAANAGSGKTRVLIERVARLLLAGAAPQRILCLTYTTAAAAEMKRRLSLLLGRWALMEDADLTAALAGLHDDLAPAPATPLADARRLFAQALETPGGLKILTIHAWCDAALRRFPLEAQVSPAFAVLDDAARATLTERARDRVAQAAATGENDAFDRIAALVGEEGLESLHREILSRRALFADPPDPARVARIMDIDAAALDEAPFEGFWAGVDRAALAAAAQAMEAGSANDSALGRHLAAALALGPTADGAAAMAAVLRTGKGAPRNFAKAPTNASAAAHPFIRPLLAALSNRFEPLALRETAAQAARRALALGAYGHAFLTACEIEKRDRAALDFDDLITGAGRLLAADGMARWAQFKLDGGVDHILVDEAQDTAPGQWAVIRALADDFLIEPDPPRGALPRTLFVVGDVKQSIYSFQGAEPALFDNTRRDVAARLAGAGRALGDHRLQTSFRSAGAILRVVDRTFAAACEGLGEPPMHAAARAKAGRVDLWPMVGKDDAADDPPWDAPLDAPAPTHPRVRLARLLGAEIARWTREEALPGEDRLVRAGDVLVLVRRRDVLAAELVRTLKRAGVAVAGADRLRIGDDLAVRDLTALARFALTPKDDLTLAALLRSPLCGLSLGALERLAARRDGPLWAALQAAPAHAAVVADLRRARAEADFLRPYEFFERALTDRGGRQALVARLGAEAEDPIDELLSRALAYEATETPTLEGFLAWLSRSEIEIRRELDAGAGAVRIMTVHGAKGLEAPVVVLPDCGPARAGRGGAVIALRDAAGPLPGWRMSDAESPPAILAAKAAAKQAALEESRRLLYVAMTRAERWLVVCAAGEPRGDDDDAPPPAETWHGLVAQAMADAGALPRPAPPGCEGTALRVDDPRDEGEPHRPDDPSTATAPPPDWLRAPAPAAPPAPLRLTAGSLGGDAAGVLSGETAGALRAAAGDAEQARLRGVAVHALLERLPDAAPADRPALAARLLARLAPSADATARAALLAQAQAAMALPGAAAAFGPDALAEVALTATLDGGRLRLSGRIDRLHVGPDQVLALDFKTDAAPPAAFAGAPEPYLRQLAAYRAALRAIHPDRIVRMALLWTALPRLDLADDALLDAALARAVAQA